MHLRQCLFENFSNLLLDAQRVLFYPTHLLFYSLKLTLNYFFLFTESNVLFVRIVNCITICLLNVYETCLVLLSCSTTLCLLKSFYYAHAAVGYTSLLIEVLICFLMFFTLAEVFWSLFNCNPFMIWQEILSIWIHIGVNVVVTVITKVRLVIQAIPLRLLFTTGVTDARFTVCLYWVHLDSCGDLVNQLGSFEVVYQIVVAEDWAALHVLILEVDWVVTIWTSWWRCWSLVAVGSSNYNLKQKESKLGVCG